MPHQIDFTGGARSWQLVVIYSSTLMSAREQSGLFDCHGYCCHATDQNMFILSHTWCYMYIAHNYLYPCLTYYSCQDLGQKHTNNRFWAEGAGLDCRLIASCLYPYTALYPTWGAWGGRNKRGGAIFSPTQAQQRPARYHAMDPCQEEGGGGTTAETPEHYWDRGGRGREGEAQLWFRVSRPRALVVWRTTAHAQTQPTGTPQTPGEKSQLCLLTPFN